jgi:small GTP-binding protein
MTERRTALRIAVVGHTNTGKTSLMRTLSRDTGFGEVSSRPSTTRHVEGVRLLADGEVLVELFDTPGMEDPIALLEVLESMQPAAGERLDGPARVERFLASEPARRRFEQEAKVLRQLLASDAGFYVVDARDPVLAKHRDELAILGACAVPLLPVLNFVRSPHADESAWREALSRLGLHAVVRFDTVAPERDGERRLYEKLSTLLDHYRPSLERLLACREREAAERHVAALRLVAGLLIDVAAGRSSAPVGDDAAEQEAIRALSDCVREREQRCVDDLLALYRFRSDDLDADQLPLADGRWQEDLFNPEVLRAMGIRLGTGAAAGAAAGVGVDLVFGGMTLGAAAALGAIAGGGVQAVRHFGDRVIGLVTRKRPLAVDDAIVRLLALRELALVGALEARGHAAIEPVRNHVRLEQWREGALAGPLQRARAHPRWSALHGPARDDTGRERAIEALAAELAQMEAKAPSP